MGDKNQCIQINDCFHVYRTIAFFFQVFHCVHFECPAEVSAIEEYERTKNVEAVNLTTNATPNRHQQVDHGSENCICTFPGLERFYQLVDKSFKEKGKDIFRK